MIPSFFRVFAMALILCLMPMLGKAQTTAQVVQNESSITFTGTQNDAPIKGQFKKFSAEINFNASKLDNSHVRVVIDTNSLSASFIDVENALKSSDWFDVKQFPQAIFQSHQFTKIGDNTYQTVGDMTIRGKTLPMTLTFVVEEISKTKVRVKGTFSLKRTQFGLGQGEWASTKEIKDDVQVNFSIIASMSA